MSNRLPRNWHGGWNEWLHVLVTARSFECFFFGAILAVGFCDNEVPIDGETWRLCGIPLPQPHGIASRTSSLATVGEDLDG
jgi:hypothetical protein